MKHWKLSDLSLRARSHTLPSSLPPAAVEVLLARGIETSEQFRFFLQPPHQLPYSPLRLSGMELALQRLVRVMNAELRDKGSGKVGIVGDFDVDGITGTAILVEGLADFGVETVPYLPHRVSEGHGLSAEAVRYMADEKVELIITVDCGVTSTRETRLARSLGMDVIITDHHIPPASPPEATAIINPRIPGNEYPFPQLCGAGLALKLVEGLYRLQGRSLPGSLMELAALGTIADMVPLQDENRYLVKAGLQQLGRTRRPGLRAIYRSAFLEGKYINEETVAFQIAPRLNAAGRMGHAQDSLRLLTTQSDAEAAILAHQLERQNRERQDLTRKIFAETHSLVAPLDPLPPFIIAEHPDITPGVAGLVAGRLSESFQRPAVALAPVDGESFLGSGRSIPTFNLIEAFNTCAELFVRHGGHSQAAGFTIMGANIPELMRRLTCIATEQLEGMPLEQALNVDAEIELQDIDATLLDLLQQLEPFGVANPKPIFVTRNLEVREVWTMGALGQHLKLLVGNGHRQFMALAFNRAEEWEETTSRVDLAYAISKDTWRGKEQINLILADFRPSESGSSW